MCDVVGRRVGHPGRERVGCEYETSAAVQMFRAWKK